MGQGTRGAMVITLVGAGNVATSLGVALQQAGHVVRQVWSRGEEPARLLARRLSCAWTTDKTNIETDVDVVIICVKDQVLETIATYIHTEALVVHTAGSIPLSVLSQPRAGVMYPMQTFSKTRVLDFADVPLFIETKQCLDMPMLRRLADSVSHCVYELTSEKRQYLHLAAVFACNFVNHCYDIASETLRSADIPCETLLPLIDETARKVHSMSARDAQTGPAIRWDRNVIDKHLALLQGLPRQIYELMSNSVHSINSHD